MGIRSVLLATSLIAAPPLAAGPPDMRLRVAADATYRMPDGSIRLSGPHDVFPMLDQVNALFMRENPGLQITYEDRGTSSGVPMITHGLTLVAPMGRPFYELDKVGYAKIVGAAPVEVRIARAATSPRDGLAPALGVYVHRLNPLASLDMSQLSRLVTMGNAKGDFGRWGQVAAKGLWAARSVHVYGTPNYTGFGDFVQSRFDGRAFSAAYETRAETSAILEQLKNDPSGIAIAASGIADPELREIALSANAGQPAVRATRETISDGTYPLARHVTVAIRRLPNTPLDPIVRAYVSMLLSGKGQAILAAGGYIPLTQSELAAEREKLL